MIHDTFKHGIFNLINFLRTRRLTLIKKVQCAKLNFQNHTENSLPVMLQEPSRPWNLQQHYSRNKMWPYECQAGSSLCISLRVRAQGSRLHKGGQERDLELLYYLYLKRGSHYCCIIYSLCKAEWMSVKIVPKDEFCLLVWFWCLLPLSLLSVQTINWVPSKKNPR